MKPDMITVKTPEGLILKVPAHVVATTFVAAALAHVGLAQQAQAPAVEAITSDQDVPAVGAYWPGQGGHNGGVVPARDGVPAHYLVFAAKDIGDHQWGGRGVELSGLSKTNGFANTEVLCNADTNHPAANACAEYQADGHHDFYLPAAAELYQGWLNTPELFAKDCYYWSSSQRSAYNAFGMYFNGGDQLSLGKDGELRVRPVRRVFI